MLIIGCDYHPSFEQIAFVDTETGEQGRARLEHRSGEAERFYPGLGRGARVGIEATGRAAWFERLLARYGHELWVGDAARIRAADCPLLPPLVAIVTAYADPRFLCLLDFAARPLGRS